MLKLLRSTRARGVWAMLGGATLAAATLLGAAALAQPPTAPDAPVQTPADKTAFARHAMVAAANPLAARAGLKVLRAGGTAIDAAVAVQAVLGLVEPQSSGLGGGAFMVYYDARTHAVTAYDGREFAPAAAGADLFLGPDGRPMDFVQALLSGRSAGAPGAVAMLAMVQHEHGARPWRDLFGDAERLADQGFIVSPRLAGYIVGGEPQATAPDVTAYFRPGGRPLRAGDRLVNPAYARTLRRIAAQGPAGLLSGPVARDIVARVRAGELPGALSLEDLAAYRPHEGPALCRPYRRYLVCAPGDPSGGAALLEGLGLLERTDIAGRGPADPQAWFELAQASRLMYADRDRYGGDPAFVSVPTAGLLDPAYLTRRAALIGEVAGPAPSPGRPVGAGIRAPDATPEPGGTSHMVIVDARGDVLSMTTTVESVFGDGRMVDGFFLNNQLTDFSFSPTDPDGAPAANAPGPHKRPRSSMAPVIVLDRQDRFVAALGSPGGPGILAYDLKALVAVLDWNLPLEQAFALPNLIAHGDSYFGEASLFAPGVVAALVDKGMVVTPGRGENSGLHGVRVKDGGLEGAADPRREGVALGY